MASSSSSIPKYLYPSHVKVGDFVSIKLALDNYMIWRKLIFDFIDSQGMIVFINGDIPEPPQMITASTHDGTREIENPDYQDWKRSDMLVREWILSTLSPTVLIHVVRLKTAQQVWKHLARNLKTVKTFDPSRAETCKLSTHFEVPFPPLISPSSTPCIIDAGLCSHFPDTNEFELCLNIAFAFLFHIRLMTDVNKLEETNLSLHLPLYKASITGDWERARRFLQENPDAIRASITVALETALMVAARSSKRIHFVKELVKLMEPEDLALGDVTGFTALHVTALIDNIAVAKMLVEKNPGLPNVWDKDRSLPIHRAAMGGKKEMVLYLLTVTNEDAEPKPFESEPGLQFVHLLIGNGMYDIALDLLQRYPKLALGEPSPLIAFTVNRSAFPTVPGKFEDHDQTSMNWAKIFIPGLRQVLLSSPDTMKNNCLHLAGYLATWPKLNIRESAAGAVLQLQRELQWFKEVENITLPQDKEVENSEKKTPAMLFVESHEELVKEGEEWMKDTANSCIIVATLIVTVLFAAAITVPGGSNGNTGLPNFSEQKAFKIFAISDALALFSSTTSMLMFLSILTSRYAEEDFLYALPKRLIIGLGTLFLSIIFMMAAFGTTVYLVFGNDTTWILEVLIGLACLPVGLFVFFQFPLLWDMIKSTYFPSIFGKRSDRILL
ncbi:Ankyrin repeat family protein [Abeliophyllum distichum]|uniref:Ankyrin repeat family protein n=1 Tax=Abeliophyllum distichum TaxID=126358 RepID=A0ABD1VTA4_9LAMI